MEIQIAVEKDLPWQRGGTLCWAAGLPAGLCGVKIPRLPAPLLVVSECDSLGFESLVQLSFFTPGAGGSLSISHLTTVQELFTLLVLLILCNICVERILYVAKSSFQTGQTIWININIPIVFQKGHSLLDQ